MGCDLCAFLDVDQEAMDNILSQHPDWDPNEVPHNEHICHEYCTLKGITGLRFMYTFDEDLGIHEMQTWYRTTFIRDDKRFTNPRYKRILETRHNQPFPDILDDMNFCIRSPMDAMEAAIGIETFFAQDAHLMDFAKWLRAAAEHCRTWELSY